MTPDDRDDIKAVLRMLTNWVDGSALDSALSDDVCGTLGVDSVATAVLRLDEMRQVFDGSLHSGPHYRYMALHTATMTELDAMGCIGWAVVSARKAVQPDLWFEVLLRAECDEADHPCNREEAK